MGVCFSWCCRPFTKSSSTNGKSRQLFSFQDPQDLTPQTQENEEETDHMSTVLKAMASQQYSIQGDPEGALTLLKQAHRLQMAFYGRDHPKTIETLVEIGAMTIEMENIDEAIKVHQEISQCLETTLGSDHKDTLINQRNIAALHLRQGDFEDAYLMFKQVLEKFKFVFGPDDPETIATMGQLGWTLSERGSFEEAIALLKCVAEFMYQDLGKDHPITRATMQDLLITVERAISLEERRKMWVQFSG